MSIKPISLRHGITLSFSLLALIAIGGCGNTSGSSSSTTNAAPAGHIDHAVPANMSIPGVSRANSAVSSLRNLRDALVTEKSQVDHATMALSEVMNGQGDLVPEFRNYTASLVDLRTAQDNVQQRINGMRTGAQEYITGWEVEVLGVDDPDLRKQAETRRNQVRANYTRINESLKGLRNSYAAFESSASGVQTALGNDLTRAGVAAVGNVAGKTNQAATTLKQQIEAAVAELDRVTGEMTPTGPATTPTALRQ